MSASSAPTPLLSITRAPGRGTAYASTPAKPEQLIHDGSDRGGSTCDHGPAVGRVTGGGIVPEPEFDVCSVHARSTGTTAIDNARNCAADEALLLARIADASRPPARWISNAAL